MRLHILLVCLICFIPFTTEAADAILLAEDDSLVIGETTTVSLSVTTQVPVNAFEGVVNFDTETFAVESIRDGDSVVSLWIDRPLERQPGQISFSGITPGGFDAGTYQLMTIRLRARKETTSTVTVSGFRALAHDGKGTDVSVSVMPEVIKISPGVPGIGSESPDREPPEYFTPQLLVTDPAFDGQSVIIFSTVDKGAGGVLYYLREFRHPWLRPLSRWRLVTSPYQVPAGTEHYYREIKAVDVVGNERISTLNPVEPTSMWPLFIGLLVGVKVLFWTWWFVTRYRRT